MFNHKKGAKFNFRNKFWQVKSKYDLTELTMIGLMSLILILILAVITIQLTITG